MYKNPDVNEAQKRRLDLKWVMVYTPIAEEIFYGAQVGNSSKRRIGGTNPKNFVQKVCAFLSHMTRADHCTPTRLIQILERIRIPKLSDDPILRKAQEHDLYLYRTKICQALIQIEKKSKAAGIDRVRHIDDEENEAFKPGEGSGWEEHIYYNADGPKDLYSSNQRIEAKVESIVARKEIKNENVRKSKRVREKIIVQELMDGFF